MRASSRPVRPPGLKSSAETRAEGLRQEAFPGAVLKPPKSTLWEKAEFRGRRSKGRKDRKRTGKKGEEPGERGGRKPRGDTVLRVTLLDCRCWALSNGNQLAQLRPLGSKCSTGSRDRKKREGNEGSAGERREVESYRLNWRSRAPGRLPGGDGIQIQLVSSPSRDW